MIKASVSKNINGYNYNPDILNCLANLSNDEVFTPPEVANQMLDTLPEDLFKSKHTTFLDPVSKSGVFLREIAKRLLKGLENEIPNLEERVNHILTKQIFGIAITELTALMTRRTVYCSKQANGKNSICSVFDNKAGNIYYERIEHTFINEKCKYCGASEELYDRDSELESHAYNFIHTEKPEEIFNNMKFDVIIGNPPYQLEVGIEKKNYSIPLYQKFVEQAKKLNPKYLTMIIPARWYAGGRGLDDFRKEMLSDKRIRKLVDYPNAVDCFKGIDLSGGVCYFLWDRDNKGNCEIISIMQSKISQVVRPLLEDGNDTFIRFNEAISTLIKIKNFKEKSFDSLVSPQTPFGIVSSFKKYREKAFNGSIEIHTVSGVKYIERDVVVKNAHWIDKHKVYISKSYGERGNYPYLFLGKPFMGKPKSCCTQTYLMLGSFNNEEECKNVIRYIRTKFFRFCIMQKKNTQDAMRGVYSFVPMQDFTEEWTDEKLYKKYKFSKEEIDFIESMIRPME